MNLNIIEGLSYFTGESVNTGVISGDTIEDCLDKFISLDNKPKFAILSEKTKASVNEGPYSLSKDNYICAVTATDSLQKESGFYDLHEYVSLFYYFDEKYQDLPDQSKYDKADIFDSLIKNYQIGFKLSELDFENININYDKEYCNYIISEGEKDELFTYIKSKGSSKFTQDIHDAILCELNAGMSLPFSYESIPFPFADTIIIGSNINADVKYSNFFNESEIQKDVQEPISEYVPLPILDSNEDSDKNESQIAEIFKPVEPSGISESGIFKDETQKSTVDLILEDILGGK